MVGDTQAERHARIRAFLDKGEPVIAVLLSAADFEWTVRRAILALGESPNVDIRAHTLKGCSGLDKYKQAWTKEVKKRFDQGLAEVVSDWETFKTSFDLRHRLVHGVTGTTGIDYARTRVEAIMRGSADVAAYARRQSVDLFGRLPVRRKNKA